MKKYFIIIVALFTGLSNSFAQNKIAIDSLQNIIISVEKECTTLCEKDTLRIKAYIELSSLILNSQPDSSYKLKQKAKNLSKELLKSTNLNVKNVSGIKNDLAAAIIGCGLYYEIKGKNDKAIEAYNEAIIIFEETNNKEGISKCLNNIATINFRAGKIIEALNYFNKNLIILQELGNKQGIAVTLNNVAHICLNQGDVKKALDYFSKSLKILEEINDKKSLATLLNSIAGAYADQGDYDKTLEFINRSLSIFEELNDKKGIAEILNNLGNIYEKQAKIDTAIIYYNKSLLIRQEIDDKRGISICFNNIAGIKLKLANKAKLENDISKSKLLINEAEDFYKKSLEIKTEINDKIGQVNVLINLAKIAKLNNQLLNKVTIVSEAYRISKDLGFPKEIQNSASLMKDIALLKGDITKAYFYLSEEITMRDSIQNEENYKAIQKQQVRYEYEKKSTADSIYHAKAMEIKNLQMAKIEKEKENQLILIYSFIVGFIIILIFSIVIFRLFIQKKKANINLAEQKLRIQHQNNSLIQANEEINAQKEEILTQRDEIEAQRDLVVEQKSHIEEIHKEVTDSIIYAKRIQQAMLPDFSVSSNQYSIFQKTTDYQLPITDNFILFRPKDIVSGDFYWTAQIENHLIFAVADCTGHGVPGAFMSMLGISFLNEIVHKQHVIQANQILNELRKEIINALQQKGESGEQKDGMDMSLVVIDNSQFAINNYCYAQFAGANNPLWIVKSDKLKVKNEENTKLDELSTFNFQLDEVKADKMPIAIYERMDNFTNHEIEINQGDCLYLMSDGYEDQFGGPKGKKFLSKNLKQLLLDNSQLPMKKQKEILEKTITDWIGNGEQIDDITVLGIKI
ncbi:MAG TPA: hypothetical protein DDX39_03955 [Bacteroidales bacterium]|nr:MAG: hypothetical protein A2W98_09115 [Bacteroidetes bacterium GWF2_33_38]HBF87775.1 hypothetical protein [Bacteroidales bacterium]